MLVLSRKPGQKLHIGNAIVVTVLEVRGSVMRLGIEAPSNVRVLRGELRPYSELAKPIINHQPAPAAVAV